MAPTIQKIGFKDKKETRIDDDLLLVKDTVRQFKNLKII